jgi:tetratricopeptide (TPR) repeat protein
VSVALRSFFAVLLVCAAYRCLVFARAAILFQQDTATSIPAALSLVPFNGAYAARLAAWQPARKTELLSKAVGLNPFDVESWIQLGLTAELERGDLLAAERYYLRAAEVDKMFLPRWTLTNFYFRHRRPADFFRWARATLEITPYPAQPVFAQMWLMTPDANRLAGVIPNRPGILFQYAMYLANEKQFNALPPIVDRLTNLVPAQNAIAYGREDVIGPMEDKLLLAGYCEPGLRIWRSLSDAHWLPYTVPTGTRPLTNGNFRQPFFGHGFDWGLVNATGISTVQNPQDGALRLTMSGDQPEHVPLLRQFIPLTPGANYHLDWRADASGISAPSGLRWRVYPLGAERDNNFQSDDLLQAISQGWRFQADTTSHCAMLTLEYARPLGSTRAAGTLTLHSVSIGEEGRMDEKK